MPNKFYKFLDFLDRINILKQIRDDFFKDYYYPNQQIQQKMKNEIYLRCENTLGDIVEQINFLSKENPYQEIAASKEIDSEFIWYNTRGEKIKDCIWRYVNVREVEKCLQDYFADMNDNMYHVRLWEDFENMDLALYQSEKERNLYPHQGKIILYVKLSPLPQKEIFVMISKCDFSENSEPKLPDVKIMTEDKYENIKGDSYE